MNDPQGVVETRRAVGRWHPQSPEPPTLQSPQCGTGMPAPPAPLSLQAPSPGPQGCCGHIKPAPSPLPGGLCRRPGVAGVEGAFRDHPAHPRQGQGYLPPDRVGQSPIQLGLDPFQWGSTHSPSGQPVLLPQHPQPNPNLLSRGGHGGTPAAPSASPLQGTGAATALPAGGRKAREWHLPARPLVTTSHPRRKP